MSRAVRKVSEAALHNAVAKFLDVVIQPPLTWTSIDAGAGKMRARTARQRKNRGVKKGWPDILILAPGPHIIAIELKAKEGKQTPEQKAVAAALWDCKVPYFLCRSVEEVHLALHSVRKAA
jgi:hypothetical protein